MSNRRPLAAASFVALVLGVAAWNDTTSNELNARPATHVTALRIGGLSVAYGSAQSVGNGSVRTYTLVDSAGTPQEVGVALSESALEGLPKPMIMTEEMKKAGHMDMHQWILDLPSQNPTPYKFVEFGWNPVGHEPENVYTVPHFDFHFYTVAQAVRDSIVPTASYFNAKASVLPSEALRAPFQVDAATAAKAPAPAVTIPQMGMHWFDVRTPELQGLTGHPENAKPFTTTYLRGSWDGKFIFDEPMITRSYILAKKSVTDANVRDEVIPVPQSGKYEPAGFYPEAYRISYDAKAKEYHVALTKLSWRK